MHAWGARVLNVDEADEASCASARVLCMLSKACVNCGGERKGRCKAMVLRVRPGGLPLVWIKLSVFVNENLFSSKDDYYYWSK